LIAKNEEMPITLQKAEAEKKRTGVSAVSQAIVHEDERETQR
jgi:hypothetical protein